MGNITLILIAHSNRSHANFKCDLAPTFTGSCLTLSGTPPRTLSTKIFQNRIPLATHQKSASPASLLNNIPISAFLSTDPSSTPSPPQHTHGRHYGQWCLQQRNTTTSYVAMRSVCASHSTSLLLVHPTHCEAQKIGIKPRIHRKQSGDNTYEMNQQSPVKNVL